MAANDEQIMQAVAFSLEKAGRAVGQALPILFRHPPTTPQGIATCLQSLDRLCDSQLEAAKITGNPSFEAAFLMGLTEVLRNQLM